MEIKDISVLNLAYLGDAVYSVLVRKRLVLSRDDKTSTLTNKSINYVSAKAQAKTIEKLINDGYLKDDELDIYRRGRNAHTNTIAKNADPITYHNATGFEALIGYLYLKQDMKRLEQIWDYIWTEMEQ